MLTRIRVEVSGEDSAAAAEAALTKYEHAIQVTEALRFNLFGAGRGPVYDGWDEPIANRDFFNPVLGREVTDEVIEYDASLPGYKGRRVVQFTRIDTRKPEQAATGLETHVVTEGIKPTSTSIHFSGDSSKGNAAA